MAKAIIICDFINEIISTEGKFKGKGYAAFAEQNNTLANTARAVEEARKLGFVVIYVRVGFSSDYKEQPKNSLLFGKADAKSGQTDPPFQFMLTHPLGAIN